MTKIKLSDLNEQERNQLIQEVDGDNAGSGVVYIGEYYTLSYRPLKDMVTGDCIGTELITQKSQPDCTWYIWGFTPEVKVYHDPKWYYLNKEPFKNRLETSVKDEIARIKRYDQEIKDRIARSEKEKSDREKAIREHTNNIRAKQLSIDSTMKSICPKSKSMIEINRERLLAEKSEVETQPFRIFSEPLVEKPEPPSHPPKSDVERGRWANDVIINSKIKWNGYKAKTRDPIKESTVTKRPVVERPVVENIVKIPKINVELIKPNDPRYLTLNEKQQRSR